MRHPRLFQIHPASSSVHKYSLFVVCSGRMMVDVVHRASVTGERAPATTWLATVSIAPMTQPDLNATSVRRDTMATLTPDVNVSISDALSFWRN